MLKFIPRFILFIVWEMKFDIYCLTKKGFAYIIKAKGECFMKVILIQDLKGKGKKGDVITLRCGQELSEDGSVRFDLRANCRYEETWILADGVSTLDQFDYKAFRYAEIILPDGCEIKDL